jgi:hypothetical protein
VFDAVENVEHAFAGILVFMVRLIDVDVQLLAVACSELGHHAHTSIESDVLGITSCVISFGKGSDEICRHRGLDKEIPTRRFIISKTERVVRSDTNIEPVGKPRFEIEKGPKCGEAETVGGHVNCCVDARRSNARHGIEKLANPGRECFRCVESRFVYNAHQAVFRLKGNRRRCGDGLLAQVTLDEIQCAGPVEVEVGVEQTAPGFDIRPEFSVETRLRSETKDNAGSRVRFTLSRLQHTIKLDRQDQFRSQKCLIGHIFPSRRLLAVGDGTTCSHPGYEHDSDDVVAPLFDGQNWPSVDYDFGRLARACARVAWSGSSRNASFLKLDFE